MAIQIRGIPIGERLRAHVAQRLGVALARLKTTSATTPALVTFFDENGPKGGLAIRCAITLRLPYRPHLRAEETARTPRLAFDGGLTRIERELERYRERARDSRRHPKKYYVAKRLAAAPASEPPGDRAAPAGRPAARRRSR